MDQVGAYYWLVELERSFSLMALSGQLRCNDKICERDSTDEIRQLPIMSAVLIVAYD